jgi:RNA polymerase sigma-70 factor (ECF subfamily)
MNGRSDDARPERERRFLELVREHEGRIHRICRVYGRADGSEDDLRQEILVQLWRSLPSFEGRSSPGTWVYRVALNTALSARRRRDSRPESPLDDAIAGAHAADAASETPVTAREPRPDERLEAKERLEQLYAAIDRLDDADKALVMMYLDERTGREMAEVLGITETHVGVKLHRIKKRMAAWIGEDSP